MMPPNSKLAQVPTLELLSRLVHPSVFTLIGLSLKDTVPTSVDSDGVRSDTYRTEKGHILLRNDDVRILVEGWLGDKPILRCALRDRQLDATSQSSPLTFFPNTDPACNRLPGTDFLAAELSIYSWDPATYLDGLDVEGSVGHFISDPDFYAWRDYDRDTYLSLWSQAFFLGRAPWQMARPMSVVPLFFVRQSIKLLKEIGYHRVDAVPSWYNVARFFKALNFEFTYGEHELAFEGIREGLTAFIARKSNDGKDGKKVRPLSRSQEAWLVALQNIPVEHIPDELRLPARWPVTHTNQYWVRMHLTLNEYTAPQSKVAERMLKKIAAMRDPSHCHDRIMVPNSGYCPCTDQLGASSPAATSPAATGDHEVRE
ncbi:MAG: hypothetical protein IAF58_19360 [Leptolyngbya sp.]|nr:hypothetical protein [Candidatus Melainabacteria bacterium]